MNQVQLQLGPGLPRMYNQVNWKAASVKLTLLQRLFNLPRKKETIIELRYSENVAERSTYNLFIFRRSELVGRMRIDSSVEGVREGKGDWMEVKSPGYTTASFGFIQKPKTSESLGPTLNVNKEKDKTTHILALEKNGLGAQRIHQDLNGWKVSPYSNVRLTTRPLRAPSLSKFMELRIPVVFDSAMKYWEDCEVKRRTGRAYDKYVHTVPLGDAAVEPEDAVEAVEMAVEVVVSMEEGRKWPH
ncbi:hypothetical protein B0H16DRAFT_1469261 [Mycena metata]|uniref:Uncharacterized protein n=1 Tax=Mycena metata TaxID=1033252 RepID=A0AAD7HYX1_9AGAR|nr:hypothetical protein B0H16DRAFT_1469261 [Mycena metata]